MLFRVPIGAGVCGLVKCIQNTNTIIVKNLKTLLCGVSAGLGLMAFVIVLNVELHYNNAVLFASEGLGTDAAICERMAVYGFNDPNIFNEEPDFVAKAGAFFSCITSN